MSLYSKHNGKQAGLAGTLTDLGNMIRNDVVVDPATTNGIVALESISEASQAQMVLREVTSLEGHIESAYRDHDIKDLTPAQKAAGAVAWAAVGNLKGYHAKAATVGNVSVESEGMVVPADFGGMAGNYDFRRSNVSVEAFNEQDLSQYMAFSVMFNVQAARQDDFSETFYKTVVITPDQQGLDIVVRRSTVLNETKHQLAGTPADFNKRNLIDAVVDYEILASETIRAIPVVDGNTAMFVDAGDVAPVTTSVDGTEFDTAPLKVGTEVDLIGISSHPGLIANGMMDQTDNLDARIHLENLYLKITGATGGGTVAATSVIALDVDRLPLSAFTGAVEGQHQRMVLNFNTKLLPLTGLTEDVTDAQAAALTWLTSGGRENWIVRLKVVASGEANIEYGNISVHVNSVEIAEIYEKDPTTGAVTLVADQATQLAAANAEFTSIAIVGYDVYATRSNANRRQRGLLVDTVEWTERHTVMMGSPITILSPVSGNSEAADLTAAVNAARIRNSNQAVTTLLNYAAKLETLDLSKDRTLDIPQIEGSGRWLVRPAFEKTELDMLTHINSIKSHERQADVAATLINTIRDLAYRLYRDSAYQAALDAMTGGTGNMPTLIIGTDPVIAKHLQLVGDTRLAGVAFEHKLVTSQDKRVRGKIFISFAREGVEGPDPLSFGVHAWIPELAGTVQVSKGGSTVKEAQVQPRNRHINVLPVLGVAEVTNLEEAVTDKIA